MNWLAEAAMLSFGIRRAALLLFAGAIAALSMPPFFLLPLLFLALPIWVWCLDGAEIGTGIKRLFGPSFSIGFYFGLGYFLVAIHWVGAAFFVDGGWMLGLMPIAVLALAAILAVFWGFASAFAHLFWHKGPWRVLALALFLTLAEFARGHLFTGFPFDLLGYALTLNAEFSQLASIIGVYGLTALVALLGTMPALIWPSDQRRITRRLVPFFTIVVVLVGQFAFGNYRLNQIELTQPSNIKLRLVQPNIPQSLKWQAESQPVIMERLLSLSETKLSPDDAGILGVSHIIWPESAMPFFLADHPEELAKIARMMPLGKYLITGAPREQIGVGATGGDYNSVLVINDDGEVVTSYDKTHLVPFGEYLPFQNLWDKFGIKQFVVGNEGWQIGDGRRALVAGATKFLPLICYEAIFSGDLGAPIADADFILNLTNDAWFDGSIGPQQHFHHARLRAIEEGRSLVRVANSGITALVDPLGRTVASLASGEIGVLDITPPAPIATPIFAQMRHWPLLALGLLSLFLLLRARPVR